MQLEGVVEHITYRNQDNHYTVARFLVYSHRHPVTVVGYFGKINTGENYKLTGEWTTHHQYGHQFNVKGYEEIKPTTVDSLERYLGSGIIKGLGPATAKKLVEKFGMDTLNIIEKDPGKLAQTPGISAKKAETISETYAQQKQIKDLFAQFSEFDISPSLSAKIYKRFGDESRNILLENPYKLADEVSGIGFMTADRIAKKTGIQNESGNRISSGVIYALKNASEQGHLYLPLKELLKNASEILTVDQNLIIQAIEALSSENKIIIEEDCVFFTPLYAMEKKVAKRIMQFNMLTFNMHLTRRHFENFFGSLSINLAPSQKEAVEQAIRSGILILTGGPGTGKTTTINSIIEFARMLKLKTILAAPTGRAAKRMEQASGHPAKTIHRLLEYSPHTHTFNRDENKTINADLFIIDESSMIDIYLFNSLLKAIPYSARLILVGDADQLPPVGPGNVLRDLIASKKIKTIHLNQIFRQSAESWIVRNSHLINQGSMPVFEPGSHDFLFIEEDDQEKASKEIINLALRELPEKYGLNPVEDIQILSPMYRGTIGVSYLNDALQNMLNSPEEYKKEIKLPHGRFRTNDKVMQIKNNYDKGVFNGDIGRITQIDEEDHIVYVDFSGGHPVKYEAHELGELVLSYACSVHKSQGSEYPCIILPLTTSHYIMLQRNLLYTAITRAKKLAVLIGSRKAISIAVGNDKIEKRYTKLSQRLYEAQNQMSMFDI
ncbi:MAG: ATP-dependent RecD-like DNA helicase [Armatimonadota bacterium]